MKYKILNKFNVYYIIYINKNLRLVKFKRDNKIFFEFYEKRYNKNHSPLLSLVYLNRAEWREFFQTLDILKDKENFLEYYKKWMEAVEW